MKLSTVSVADVHRVGTMSAPSMSMMLARLRVFNFSECLEGARPLGQVHLSSDSEVLTAKILTASLNRSSLLLINGR